MPTLPTTHACPAKGCDQVVAFEVLACKKHWFEVPYELRKRISRTWRNRDLTDWAAAREEAVYLLSSG